MKMETLNVTYKTLLYVACTMLLGMPVAGQNAAVKPSIDPGGKITFGSKSIRIKEGYSQVDMVIADTVSIFGTTMFNFGAGDVSPCFFLNKKMEREKDGIRWDSDVVALRGRQDILGQYSISLSLRQDDLIKLSIHCKLNQGVKPEKNLFYLDCRQEVSGYYNVGPRKIDLQPKQVVEWGAEPGISFTLFPDNPAKTFRIIPETYSSASVYTEKGKIVLTPLEGDLEFLLEMGGEKEIYRSNEYYGGTDFGKIDQLHLPQYNTCRNLIQNPSFEAAMRYFGYKSFGSYYQPDHPDVYSIDADTAAVGKRSLRIKALKRLSLPIGTFAIPLTPGTKHVLSFYAKGNLPEGLSVRLDGRATSTWWMFADRKCPLVEITDEWKRYSVSFTPIEEFYSVYFQGFLDRTSAADEGLIWLDGLQLEANDLSAYAEMPFSMQLKSSGRGNFLNGQQDPAFRLLLNVKPGQCGSADVVVEDFFLKEILRHTYTFTAGSNGEAVVRMPELDKRILSDNVRGVFAGTVELTLAGADEPYRDYVRFSVMVPLENKHKNKDLFCIGPGRTSNVLCTDGVDRRLARFRDIGFGSAAYVFHADHAVEKRLLAKLREYGFADVGRHVIDKRQNGGTISEDEMEISNLREWVDPTPEQLEQYEAICEAKARNRPWISTWYFAGEIEGMKPFMDHPEAVGKLLVATLKGIKKGNPKAKVHMGGSPWNIEENGREWSDQYIKAVTEADPSVRFDGTAIHTYRMMPEHPDLDAATAAYIEILRKYGYEDSPIYWDEGANYFEYLIPGRGMTPYHGNSGDKWYPGMLTYDMGRAERIAAAFSARTWLVALKYMKNIACLHDFSIRRYFWDFDLTVGAKMKVVNTLGRILGDADFHQDIRFAPDCRCYMFMDQMGRPIAAIWGHDQAVDRGEEAAPVFRFNFEGQTLKFLDLMETEQTFPVANGFTQIPVSPFPLFIIGEAGMAERLTQSIAGGENVIRSQLPVSVYAMPLDAERAELRFSNALTAPLSGRAAITLNSVSTNYALAFSANGSRVESLPMQPTPAPLKAFNCSVSIHSGTYMDKQVNIDGTFTFLPSEQSIAIDGNAEDWKEIPAVQLAPGVSVRSAVGGNTLYIATRTDTATSGALATVIVNASPTCRDWAEFKTREQDMYVYEMLRGDSGALAAFCHYVPSVQADSGPWTPKPARLDARITGRVETLPDGEFLEMAFPAASLMPLTLSHGERFGLNLVLKKGESVLSLAPVKDYLNAKEPGKVKLVLGFVE